MPKETELYKEILNDLPEGIIVCDSENKILEINKNFEKISGYTKKELYGKNLLDILKPSRGACSVDEIELDQEDDQAANLFQLGELNQKNGHILCIRINHAITNNKIITYLIIPFSNIAFLNQAHIDFVSTVSHELRTPLTSIKGFADTLISSGNRLNQDQQLKFIGIIKSQVDRLTRLVENLLTVSKLEARQSKSIYKAVEIKNMIEGILYNIQHKSKNHKIECNILPNLPPVWADSDKLEQVLMNLVDNAVKYSNSGTHVFIYAGFLKNKPDFIEIKVKDEGFGIPEEFLSKIFTKFSRIDNPLTRGVQGTGLGLYITKSLVNSMKGDIFVESNKKGSTFTVILPVASPEKQAQERFLETN
jgi:two-component system phosphate regulon sensor histidine kinase PhoR